MWALNYNVFWAFEYLLCGYEILSFLHCTVYCREFKIYVEYFSFEKSSLYLFCWFSSISYVTFES